MKKNGHYTKKIVHFDNLLEKKEKTKANKIVLVGGCFDLLHFGHVSFLAEAKKHGDFLIVALESDDFIKKVKKREPVHTQEQRAHILSHLEIVDKVIKLPHLKDYGDYLNLVKTVSPSIIAVTEGDERLKEKEKQANEIGAKLKVVCSLVFSPSTSNIIKYASIFGN